jgi:hypothetical protein
MTRRGSRRRRGTHPTHSQPPLFKPEQPLLLSVPPSPGPNLKIPGTNHFPIPSNRYDTPWVEEKEENTPDALATQMPEDTFIYIYIHVYIYTYVYVYIYIYISRPAPLTLTLNHNIPNRYETPWVEEEEENTPDALATQMPEGEVEVYIPNWAQESFSSVKYE